MSRSLHLVEPALRRVVAGQPVISLDRTVLDHMRDAERQLVAARTSRLRLPQAVVEEHQLPPDPDGAAPRVYCYRPVGDAVRPAMLHLHGGGFVSGSALHHDIINQQLCATLDCVIVSVEYRLAPEAPHPAALHDCHAALRWLAAAPAPLGIDPSRIVVSGESAGGGLAASLCHYNRDRGGPSIAAQVLTYPMLDDRTSDDPDPNPCTGEFMWTRESNRFGWSALLGSAAEPPVHAVPARMADLSGLPPATLFVGTLDLFFDEVMGYARRLARAQVPTELHVYPGAYHGFDMVADARATQELARHRLRAWRDALHPAAP